MFPMLFCKEKKKGLHWRTYWTLCFVWVLGIDVQDFDDNPCQHDVAAINVSCLRKNGNAVILWACEDGLKKRWCQ